MPNIRDLIQYNPDTGSFKWIMPVGNRHVGSPAGSYNKRGYLKINVHGVTYQATHLAWFLTYGEWPQGIIDHIDRNPSNNKLSNLRDIPHRLNTLNRRGNSKTGLPKGVYKNRHGSYNVMVWLLGRLKYIGRFKTLEEATMVAEAAQRKQWELAEQEEAERDRPAMEALIADIDLDALGL
jgi:hypothetical protein